MIKQTTQRGHKTALAKYNTLYYESAVTFIEQPLFTRLITELVDDDRYREFQNELARSPEKGPVVPGSGGLRKARMSLPGRGKSGGARVLYLYFPRRLTIVLLPIHQRRHREHSGRGYERNQK